MMAESFAGINPYQFAINNPVMFNDPNGALSQKAGDRNPVVYQTCGIFLEVLISLGFCKNKMMVLKLIR